MSINHSRESMSIDLIRKGNAREDMFFLDPCIRI